MEHSMFIGLDVHKATISVAVADGKRGGEVRSWGVIAHRAGNIQKVVEKLGASGRHLHFCYEAGLVVDTELVLHADRCRLQPRQAAKTAGRSLAMRLTAPGPVKRQEPRPIPPSRARPA